VITAFSKTLDVRMQITPLLDSSIESELLLIDLGKGQNRLGGSCLAQVYNLHFANPALDKAFITVALLVLLT
jgi:phosphoribosylformylglycinamidine synthase